MTKRLLVTGTDDSHHNQAALLLFLAGCFNVAPCFFDEITIVTPIECTLHPVLLDYLYSKKITVQSLPPVLGTDRHEDPYSIKLLLLTLLKSVTEDIEEVLYLDPDHLVFSAPSLVVPGGAFYVSSEIYPPLPDTPLAAGKGSIVYNTSFIYASLKTWLSIADPWVAAYLNLRSSVDFRHREEMAFTCATENTSCKVIPISPNTQGNFSRLSIKSSLFHYGGEGQGAYAIKSYLAQIPRDLQVDNLSSTTDHALKRVQQMVDHYQISDATKPVLPHVAQI